MAFRIKKRKGTPPRLDGRIWSENEWVTVEKLSPRLEREQREERYLIIEAIIGKIITAVVGKAADLIDKVTEVNDGDPDESDLETPVDSKPDPEPKPITVKVKRKKK